MNFNIHARSITPTHSEAKHKYKSTHAVTLTRTHTHFIITLVHRSLTPIGVH